ncbi:IS110 family transposase [Belnapia moabensis]|uniref:IS110 family transposase n=1 Tax=Belnapia moabensis TaxID=365533 RepID=UPI001B802218
MTIRVRLEGYRELEIWARLLRAVRAFGIEGTGAYGAGLARFLRAAGHTVHEAGRPDRRLRHRHGKTDRLDAEGAARAVLGGQATALPKAGTGEVEMIRHLKVARDPAVKARTQAMLALKAIMISAPTALREQLEAVAGRMALVRHLAVLRPGPAADHDHRLSQGQPACHRPSLARPRRRDPVTRRPSRPADRAVRTENGRGARQGDRNRGGDAGSRR